MQIHYSRRVGKGKGPSVGSVPSPVQCRGRSDSQPVKHATWVCMCWVCDSIDINNPGTLSKHQTDMKAATSGELSPSATLRGTVKESAG